MKEQQDSATKLRVDWEALKESKAQQVDAWAGMLGQHDDGTRPLTSDTARVQAQRHLQRCEDELDRIDMLEAITKHLDDRVDIAYARADLATLEGSHVAAIQWTNLASRLENERRLREEEARQAAAAIGQPDTELGRLAQVLLAAPQAVREELARVMLAGVLPADWKPSEIIRLPDVA